MSTDKNDNSRWFWIILVIAVGLYLLWQFVIQPFIIWVQQHWITIVTVLAIILLLFIVGLILYFIYKKSIDEKVAEHQRANIERKLLFEEEQRSRGLEKFINSSGIEQWGTWEQIKFWQDEEYRKTLIHKIKNEIDMFEPASYFSEERLYHVGLFHWLQSKFPNARYEWQLGASRPDIVIENVAIEIKGPSDASALQSIAFKCVKYSNQYQHFIVVLFDPIYTQQTFDEFSAGIRRAFPHVEIVEKKRK